MAAKRQPVKSKAKTTKKPPETLSLDSVDPDLFGSIKTDPPKLFPYRPRAKKEKELNIPYPETPDPFGAGAAALEFLDLFTLAEGRAYGKPLGESLSPSQRRAVTTIMGHRDPKTATRYIQQALFTGPRKSAKTMVSALFGMLFLFSRHEPGGEILITATSRRQGRRCFDLLMAILRTNSTMLEKIRVQEHIATLTNLETGTRLVVTVADPNKIMGLSPSVILADECAFWPTGDRGHRLWNSLVTGQGARPNPLWIITSTVPDHKIPDDDVFMQNLKYAMEVMSGERDDRRFLPMVWLTDQEADIDDEATWIKANPGLGYSLSLDELREAHARSHTSDAERNAFKTLRLNQLPKGSMAQGWLSPQSIERCMQPFTEEEFLDADIKVIGVDLGGTFDLACVTVLAYDGERLMAKQISWICEEGFQRLKVGASVEQFVERGELVVSGDSAVNFDHIVGEIIDLAEHYETNRIALDPAMTQLVTPQLEAAGMECIGCRQGSISMAPAIAFIENLVSDDNFLINDELARWCLENTGLHTTSTGAIPRKMGSDSSANPMKIDFTSAMLTGTQLLLDERAGTLNEDYRGFEVIDPWTAPNDATAWQQGYDVMGIFWPRTDLTTGAYIVTGSPLL